jgi:hypothetical protein
VWLQSGVEQYEAPIDLRFILETCGAADCAWSLWATLEDSTLVRMAMKPIWSKYFEAGTVAAEEEFKRDADIWDCRLPDMRP